MKEERENERWTRASGTKEISGQSMSWGRRSDEGILAILVGPRAKRELSRINLLPLKSFQKLRPTRCSRWIPAFCGTMDSDTDSCGRGTGTGRRADHTLIVLPVSGPATCPYILPVTRLLSCRYSHSRSVFRALPTLRDMDSKAQSEKLKNYEAQYANYLKAKYFSDKDIYGGKIFQEKATIDGMTIRASSEPGTRSYADPVGYWNEKYANIELQTETTTELSNGKHSSKKSG
ncbi:hypothetical protein L1887_11344 [Cichorium endivia]|nr:hypothetical protein L1887_11344 [Cichorium endivia]